MQKTGIATIFLTTLAFAGHSFAGPNAAQSLNFGTSVGNPGKSIFSGFESLSTGRDMDPGGTTKSITPIQECRENKHGFEECEFYLIWCPTPGEECIEVH